MKYRVERYYSYGWDDAGFSEDDIPMTFDSVEAAQAAIDDSIEAQHTAVAQGCMTCAEAPSDYRIVPITT